MSTLRDDDLFLVNRERESYTISYEDLKEQLGGGSAGIIQTGLIISASPDLYVGAILTAEGGTGAGPNGALTPTYQWKLNDVDIAGATNKTHEALTEGTYKCVATVVDGDLSSDTTSNELIIENKPGEINKPSIILPVKDGETLNPGETTYLISDSIIDIEDVGGGQTKLTVSGDKDLTDKFVGSVLMSDGTPAGGEYDQKGYKLVTTDIESVNDANPDQVVLTFPGAVSTNPDLQYFRTGDLVQQYSEGNIRATTDAGDFFTDSDVIDGYDDIGSVFAPGASDGFVLIQRSSAWMEFEFQDPIEVTSTIFNYAGHYSDKGLYRFYANDVQIGGNYETIGGFVAAEPIPFTGTLRKIRIESINGDKTDGLAIKYFLIDADDVSAKITGTPAATETATVISTGYPNSNTMTVDGGSWLGSNGSGEANGATHVEYQTNGGEGEIVSVNTDDDTILLTNTGDRDNRWIAENKAGTDFFVAGPVDVDNLLTADIEFKCSDFSTTPSDADTWKNTRWELDVNGTKTYYDVDDETTWKPGSAILSPNTTYKVRVQHEGNLLDPSEQSGTVTITTGASRTAHEIVTSDIDMLKEWQEEVIKEEYNHIQNAEAIAAIVEAKRDHLNCKVLCETEYCASICDAQFAAAVAQILSDYNIGGN